MAKKDFLQIKVNGLRELDEALNALDLDLRKKTLKAAGKNSLLPVAERAKQNVPVDTGDLKETIKVSATTDLRRLRKMSKKRGTSMIASVYAGRTRIKRGSGGHQALQVEYGTSKTRAQPFMRPAIRGRERSTILRFRIDLRKGIQKTAKTQERRTRRLLKR